MHNYIESIMDAMIVNKSDEYNVDMSPPNHEILSRSALETFIQDHEWLKPYRMEWRYVFQHSLHH